MSEMYAIASDTRIIDASNEEEGSSLPYIDQTVRLLLRRRVSSPSKINTWADLKELKDVIKNLEYQIEGVMFVVSDNIYSRLLC
jgi:hypothetical protein